MKASDVKRGMRVRVAREPYWISAVAGGATPTLGVSVGDEYRVGRVCSDDDVALGPRTVVNAACLEPAEPTRPDWQRRAERKEFKVGDVVVWESGSESSAHSRYDHDGPTRTIADVTDDKVLFTNKFTMDARNCSLLRPVDWKSSVGERVVCIDSSIFSSEVYPGLGGGIVSSATRWGDEEFEIQFDGLSFTQRTATINDASIAPAVLAEPLLPLLRGATKTEERGSEEYTVHDPGRVESAPAYTVNISIPTGEKAKVLTSGLLDALRDAKARREREEVMRNVWWNKENPHIRATERAAIIIAAESGDGIEGNGLTLRRAAYLERWTSHYYTPIHCPRCGADGGCFCPRVTQ